MRASHRVLFVYFAAVIAVIFLYVPRLVNPIWSDAEFTGWVSPIAHRIAQGDVIYRDFTLPISPGSFTLVSLLQKLTGRFQLVDELWLCAVAQLLMSALAYALVRPFTSVRNASLTAMLTMPLLVASPKEIAYDHTAQLVAWTSLVALAQGFTAQGRRAVWFASAGFAAAMTLWFKSSTGLGAIAGGLAAVAYFVWHQRDSDRCFHMTLRHHVLRWFATGLAAGASVTLLLVLVSGASVREFLYVVFIDGPRLKGGSLRAIGNLMSYSLLQTPVHFSLLSTLVFGYVLAKLRVPWGEVLCKRAGTDPSFEQGVPGWVYQVGFGFISLLTLGIAILLLVGNAPHLPFGIPYAAGAGTAATLIGLFFLLILMLTSMLRRGTWDNAHAWTAIGMAAWTISLIHNLSDPNLRPIYDNNPIIPLAIASLLVVFDAAKLRTLKYTIAVVLLFTWFGPKFDRYLAARFPTEESGYWKDLRVSRYGLDLLTVARKARELAGPDGTVLMMPEDPMFTALIGKPRPRLRSAIVFVDQMPSRTLSHDLQVLREQPPAVLLRHPTKPSDRDLVYRIWNQACPAGALQDSFMAQFEPSYESHGQYPVWYFGSPTTLELLTKKPSQ